jgi:hypothetical protein
LALGFEHRAGAAALCFSLFFSKTGNLQRQKPQYPVVLLRGSLFYSGQPAETEGNWHSPCFKYTGKSFFGETYRPIAYGNESVCVKRGGKQCQGQG